MNRFEKVIARIFLICGVVLIQGATILESSIYGCLFAIMVLFSACLIFKICDLRNEKKEVETVLKKYISHVEDCEGTNFKRQINQINHDVTFTEKEKEVLLRHIN